MTNYANILPVADEEVTSREKKFRNKLKEFLTSQMISDIITKFAESERLKKLIDKKF